MVLIELKKMNTMNTDGYSGLPPVVTLNICKQGILGYIKCILFILAECYILYYHCLWQWNCFVTEGAEEPCEHPVVALGSYHFLLGGGICLWLRVANIFWSPLGMLKKILVPPLLVQKNAGRPLGLCQKILVSPRDRTPPYINNENLRSPS